MAGSTQQSSPCGLPAQATAAAQPHLAAAAELLGADAEGLAKALTTRTRQTVDGGWVGRRAGAAEACTWLCRVLCDACLSCLAWLLYLMRLCVAFVHAGWLHPPGSTLPASQTSSSAARREAPELWLLSLLLALLALEHKEAVFLLSFL